MTKDDSFYVVPFVFHLNQFDPKKLKFADLEGMFDSFDWINVNDIGATSYFNPEKKRRSRLTGHSNEQTQKIIEIVVHMCCVVYICHMTLVSTIKSNDFIRFTKQR